MSTCLLCQTETECVPTSFSGNFNKSEEAESSSLSDIDSDSQETTRTDSEENVSTANNMENDDNDCTGMVTLSNDHDLETEGEFPGNGNGVNSEHDRLGGESAEQKGKHFEQRNTKRQRNKVRNRKKKKAPSKDAVDRVDLTVIECIELD